MKRKKTQAVMQDAKPAAQAVPPPKAAANLAERVSGPWGLPGWTVLAVLGLLLYLGVFMPTLYASVGACFFVLVVTLLRFSSVSARFEERFSLPALGFFLFAFSCGISAIYATVGNAAAPEMGKVLAFVPITAAVLLWLDRRHLRAYLWIYAALVALAAFLCVDTSASGIFYGAFTAVMDALGADYGALRQYVDAGRINGLFNNANVTASITALGGLVAIYLTRTGEKKWERPVGCFLVGLSAMGFFLSMSRGGILAFGVALVVYVIATAKEDRLSLVFFLVETVVVTIVLSAVAMGFLGDDGSFIPDILTLLCGPAVYAVDRFVGAPVAKRLSGHGKAIALVFAALLALAVVYVIAALNITGAYTFVSGQRLYRPVELTPGEYTVDAQWSGDITLYVNAMVSEDATRHQNEELYAGPLGDVTFTVPEDAIGVAFALYGEGGARVESLQLTDGTTVPLGYPLLPDFVANRMGEDLLKGSSLSLRKQYVVDGLKLFAKKPLLGYGLGGTQGWLVSVQDFYYESRYLHNQVAQVMAEQGLVGLVSWLLLMGGSVWLLLRRLKEEKDALAAVMLACVVMMNLHSLMEINFSIRGSQCAAYVLLALVMLAYPQPLVNGNKQKGRAARITVLLMAGWMLFFGVTYCMYWSAHNKAANLEWYSNDQYLNDMKHFADVDLYDPESQQISYVANAMVLNSPYYRAQVLKYVEALEKSGTYAGCTAVGRYYCWGRQDLDGMFAYSRKGLQQVLAYRDLWNEEYLYYFETILPQIGPEQYAEFVAGVNATRAMQTAYEEGRIEKIDIAILIQTYFDAMDAGADLPVEEAYAQMLLVVCDNM